MTSPASSTPTASKPTVTAPVKDDSKSEKDKVDLGNHELDEWNPPHVNDEGKLVDDDGNTVFTTTEQAIKDGDFVLDAKGRMPGVYLDDLEDLERRSMEKAVSEANKVAADSSNNTVVERQVKVANSGMPPITVVTKQEHPTTGEAQSEDAKVPELESNPLPAE